MVKVDRLCYTYDDGTQALRDVSFTIEQGQRVAFVGSNGSGKTTLFLCLIGILNPTSGHIELDGQPIEYDRHGLVKLRKRIGIVFQEPDAQLFCVNVFQEVAFGPANLGLDDDEINRRAQAVMAKTDVAHLQARPPHLLSYGQKKRVSVASVLSMEPDILIFDEPTSALDPVHARELMRLIDELGDEGITILLSTHDMDLALDWADELVVMLDGQVARCGSPEAVFADEPLFSSAGLARPTVFRLYQFLMAQGMLPSDCPVPHNVQELEAGLLSVNNNPTSRTAVLGNQPEVVCEVCA